MEGSVALRRKRTPSGRETRPKSDYDNALIAAKVAGKTVDLVLAADFACPDGTILDADKTIKAIVDHVDTYAVKFQTGNGKEVWISKAFIAGVWI